MVTKKRIGKKMGPSTIHRAAFPYNHLPPVKETVYEVTNHYHDEINHSKTPRKIYRDSAKSGILSNGQRVYLEGSRWIYVRG